MSNGGQLSRTLVHALEQQLYLWALAVADGGAPATSPIYQLMQTRVQNPRHADRVLLDHAASERVERAMAAIKRESPALYPVLKEEALAQLGGERRALQVSRARNLRISPRTYCERLRRGRLYLAGLLYGPAIIKQQRERAGQ